MLQATACHVMVPCPSRHCALEIEVPIVTVVSFHEMANDPTQREMRATAQPESQPIWDHLLVFHGPE